MDDRTPLGLRRLTVLKLDASSTAIRLWGLNGDSTYIHKVQTRSIKVLDTKHMSARVVDIAERE